MTNNCRTVSLATRYCGNVNWLLMSSPTGRKRPLPVGQWALSDEQRQEAWEWWVGKLVRSCCDTKSVSVAAKVGGAANRNGQGRDGLLYSPGVPPKIQKPVPAYKLVDWTPDADKVNTRHQAGIDFLNQVDELLAKPKLPADVKEALTLAATAIRATS